VLESGTDILQVIGAHPNNVCIMAHQCDAMEA